MKQAPFTIKPDPPHRAGMIVTRTIDSDGKCRVYIGGKSSVDFWIEPTATGWTLGGEHGLGSASPSNSLGRQCVVHQLLRLAEALNISPSDLNPGCVPFEAIEALHCANPLDRRRVATPWKRQVEHGYMAAEPGITRPSANVDDEEEIDRKKRR